MSDPKAEPMTAREWMETPEHDAVVDRPSNEPAWYGLHLTQDLMEAYAAHCVEHATKELRQAIEQLRAAWGLLKIDLQRVEQERDEAIRIAGCVPSDILEKMLHPPVCGVSDTTESLGMSAQRLGGCGQLMNDPRQWFRCADCGVPFHQKCLQNHCKSEIEAAARDLTAAREALRKYGRHIERGCAKGAGANMPCTCGFDSVLAGAPPAEGGK